MGPYKHAWDPLTKAEIDLHQALRRSHCEHANRNDEGHACVGVTVISPNCIALNCRLCGNDAIEDRMRVGAEARTHLHVLAYDVGNAVIKIENLLCDEERALYGEE